MPDLRRLAATWLVDPVFWGLVKRCPIEPVTAEYRRLQWDSVERFRERQRERLAHILRHALTRVPLYSERLPSIDPDEVAEDPFTALARMPALERRDLLEDLHRLHAGLGRGVTENSSGGSTGTPVRFYQDRAYHAAALATTRLFLEWGGVKLGERHVKLWGAHRDIGGRGHSRRRRIMDLLENRITLDAFIMGDDEMERYASIVNAFAPVCLEGYAEALDEFAALLERRDIGIARPRAVVSSAGSLLPHMRQRISRVFRAPVYDRYGTREVGNVANECDHHEGLHVFGETTIVEIVDDGMRPVPVGGEGELLVTNLTNYTMPLIRYRIGDRAVRGADRCSCGRPYPLLERILGRTAECLRLSGGGVVLPEFFIHVIGVESEDRSIRRFQVAERGPDDIVVRVVLERGSKELSPRTTGHVAARIREAMGEATRVSFEVVDAIEPGPSGKHRYVVREAGGAPG